MAGWAQRWDWLAGKGTFEPGLEGSGGQSFGQDRVGYVGSSELPLNWLGRVGEECDPRRTMSLGEEYLIVNRVFIRGPRLVLIIIQWNRW